MITAALVGNPNVGKTSLFNALTGSNQYVGNWAGVTVEKKEGYINNLVKVVDLPGIYAMDTYSNEERVSKNYLSTENVDVILNIVDASNLERNLYLTYQLKEFKKPIILLLNMMDIVEEKNIKIDFELLSKELKVKVIPISASKNMGISNLKKVLMADNFFGICIDNEFQFRDEETTYSLIEKVLQKTVLYDDYDSSSITDKIDDLVLNKFLAYPIFLAILYIIFQFTFSWVGQPLSDLLDNGLNNILIPYLNNILSSLSPWFKSLLVDGIVGGVGSVIVFLPIILSLFLGISFLEDSGYMSRAAFIMDKLMRNMGLSGKAFIPLIIGFGCSVPGIMASRTLESEKDRKLTALLVPLMSCNARLPVYALFASVFFPGNETLVVFSLYFLGILIAFLIGILFKNTIFKKDEEPFIIELPQYKMPEYKSLFKLTWEKGKGFLKKAGTIIFAASVVIWFLSNFNFSGMVEINDSLLAYLGKFIAPVFKPLGFGSWQNSVAILTGITAKEIILSSMGVIYGGNLRQVLPNNFTTLSSYSFLIFVLLYTPCVSVVAAMKKEYGTKMMLFSILYQLILAWIVSFIAYNIGLILI